MKILVTLNVLIVGGLTLLFRFSPHDAPARNIVLHEVCRITGNGRDTVTQVGEIASDSKGNIFITDEYQWAVKKYTASGKLLRRYGKRGKDPGSFQAGPFLVNCAHDTLAVVETGSPRVLIFTRDFRPVREVQLPGAILDVTLGPKGQLYAATVQPPSRFERTLALYTMQGTLSAAIPLADARKDPILDMTTIAVDGRNYLVVAYRFVNDVMVFDDRHRLAFRFAVPGLPRTSAQGLEAGNFTAMPDDLIRDIALDGRGHVFILGGIASTHPNRDLYVIDYTGQLQAAIVLPQKCGALHLDQKGNLYLRENQRTVVKKYRIEYVNF